MPSVSDLCKGQKPPGLGGREIFAPKGQQPPAQGNALGIDAKVWFRPVRAKALNMCSELRAFATQNSELLPLRGVIGNNATNPGRCPGLLARCPCGALTKNNNFKIKKRYEKQANLEDNHSAGRKHIDSCPDSTQHYQLYGLWTLEHLKMYFIGDFLGS